MTMNSFKKMIMMANQIDDKPSLPSEYMQLEYLESTGTQYILTNVYPNNTYTFDTKLKVTVKGDVAPWGVRSVGTSNTVNSQCYLNYNLNATNKNIMLFSTSKSLSTNYNTGEQAVLGNTYDLRNMWVVDSMIQMTYPVMLFGLNTIGTLNVSVGKGIIYRWTAYSKGIAVCDLIPALRIADSKPGMYDLITGQFFTNKGTEEFVYHIEGVPIPYLAFEALEDDLQVSVTKSATQYSLDRVNWIDLPAEELTQPISKGEKVWFRANITPDNTSTGIGTFSCTKRCNLEGTPMSLLYGDRAGDYTFLPNKAYCFTSLFRNNDNIIRVNNPKNFLPATVLTDKYCYQSMFYGCSNLVNMCYLPALVLTQNCYNSMYYKCSSLVEIFDFPEWIQMAGSCCSSMFSYCTSLKKQPKITTKLDSTVYSCFNGMFAYCVNMEECQEVLHFTTVAQSSYAGMYRKTKIKKAPNILAKVCNGVVASLMTNMFNDCTELVEGPSNLYIEEIGQSTYEGIFQNCYKLKKSPIIHQKTSDSLSNRYMFENCINLEYIVLLQLDPFTNTATNDFQSWVNNVSPTGTIVLNKNIKWNPDDYRGTSSIPAGWEVKYCDPDNIDDVRDYREIDQPW